MLAVGREDVVLGAQRAAGADLRGLLAEELGPQAELAVPLQGGGFDVEAADEDHIAVEPADQVRLLGGVQPVPEAVVGMLDSFALGREELDELVRTGWVGQAALLRLCGSPGSPDRW